MASQEQSESGAAPEERARSAEEIQAEIQQTRERLVGNIDLLKQETSPKALAGKAQTKVREVFVDDSGAVRSDRVAMVAGAVLGLLVLRRVARGRRHRAELRRLAEVVWVPVPRASVSPELAGRARNARELAPLAADLEPRLAIEA